MRRLHRRMNHESPEAAGSRDGSPTKEKNSDRKEERNEGQKRARNEQESGRISRENKKKAEETEERGSRVAYARSMVARQKLCDDD
jgi:hypothetical protein